MRNSKSDNHKSQKTYAIIFARGGSKGVKRKNIRIIEGKPLIAYSIEAALANENIDRVYISTEDKEIADISEKYGAEVPFLRPKKLALDDSSEWLAWQHSLEYFRAKGDLPEIMVSLPPTSPLRASDDINLAYNHFLKNEFDIVIAVTKSKRHPMFNMVKIDDKGLVDLLLNSNKGVFRRQDAPIAFDITTSVYVAKSEYVLNATSLFEGRIGAIEVPEERAIDIDTEFDLYLASLIIRDNKN